MDNNEVIIKLEHPDGKIEAMPVTKDQLMRMLHAASNNPQAPAASAAPAPAPLPAKAEPQELAMQLAQLQQLQLQMLQGAELTEIQKCQLDPERMKWWAVGLPLGGAVIGGLLTAFGMSLCSNND